MFDDGETLGFQAFDSILPVLEIDSWRSDLVLSFFISPVLLFATPWTAAHQASLSLSISQSLHKFMSTELVMLAYSYETPFTELVMLAYSYETPFSSPYLEQRYIKKITL